MRIVGQSDLSSMFGVVPKTIIEWQETGLPISVQGGPGVPSEYESADCIRWLVDREVRKVQAESPKDRLLRLQGDALEMDLATQRGQLIPAAAVEPAMRSAIVTARERIRNEPARLATLMEGKDRGERENLLRALFDEVLEKLSHWRRSTEEGCSDERAA
ncbi:Phage terminase Nu1 subunit (DNA packaging protein) [Georgfuchsia toluolica]|uniref:Phage terminase Nu1 subunit (DNA packaging protein) n=1 Tax=Georgfuchsia toluolica TaxID=424218 RepID=A0A916J5Z5_9PROT|nr:terminase small subunit [Georgfuchsia toluolica]CAG4883800.1 Phage terminase Nu1 subunit (DNA packaging protein) [Georgfuchsia toluolica]